MFRWFKKKDKLIANNMELNKKRKEYLLNLLDKAIITDLNFEQFGSKKHKYKLNPVISETKVLEVEKKYNFKLPEDYFWFITNVGNGGAGPYYGLEKFKIEDVEYLESLGKKTVLSPMKTGGRLCMVIMIEIGLFLLMEIHF